MPARRPGAGDLVGRLFAALAGLAWLPGAAVVVLGLPLIALQYFAVSTLLPSAVRAVVPAPRPCTAYGQVFTSWGVAGVLAPALHDMSRDDATSFRSLLLAAAMAAVALSAFERQLRSPGRQTR